MRKEVSTVLTAASLLFILLGFAGRAAAVPTYSASIQCVGPSYACGAPVAQVLNSTSPISLEEQYPPFPEVPLAQATAKASYGELQGLSQAELLTFLTPDSKSASEFSKFLLDDIYLIGEPNTLVPWSVDLVFSGSFMVDGFTLGVETLASSTVNVSGSLIVPNIDQVNFSGSISAAATNGVPGIIKTGVLSSFPGSTDALFNTASGSGSILITSPAVMAPVGVPLTLELGLSTSALASSTVFGIPAEAVMDVAHTLGFPTTGPVFNVPAGYTVNSTSGFIVDNHFVTSQPGPVPVPEPSTMLLFGSGLIGLAFAKRIKG